MECLFISTINDLYHIVLYILPLIVGRIRGRLSELFYAVLCSIIVYSHMHIDEQFLQVNCFRFRCRFCVFMFYWGQYICVRASFLCLLYFLSVCVWLSVPVQLIAWKDSSPN